MRMNVRRIWATMSDASRRTVCGRISALCIAALAAEPAASKTLRARGSQTQPPPDACMCWCGVQHHASSQPPRVKAARHAGLWVCSQIWCAFGTNVVLQVCSRSSDDCGISFYAYAHVELSSRGARFASFAVEPMWLICTPPIVQAIDGPEPEFVKEQGPSIRILVRARATVCAAGALRTPALLLRSNITGKGNVGRYLRVHPAALALGWFETEGAPILACSVATCTLLIMTVHVCVPPSTIRASQRACTRSAA